jgi:hypothetical protein
VSAFRCFEVLFCLTASLFAVEQRCERPWSLRVGPRTESDEHSAVAESCKTSVFFFLSAFSLVFVVAAPVELGYSAL